MSVIIRDDFDKGIDTGGVKEYCIVEEKQKMHGSIRLHKGHKIFELDLVKQVVFEAELGPAEAHINKDNLGIIERRRKLQYKENHLYCSALNFENATKKFRKALGVKKPKEKTVHLCEEPGCTFVAAKHTNIGALCQNHLDQFYNE